MEVKKIIVTEAEKKKFYNQQKIFSPPKTNQKTENEYNEYLKNHRDSIELKKVEDLEII